MFTIIYCIVAASILPSRIRLTRDPLARPKGTMGPCVAAIAAAAAVADATAAAPVVAAVKPTVRPAGTTLEEVFVVAAG